MERERERERERETEKERERYIYARFGKIYKFRDWRTKHRRE
jgi:hypothetical protein